MTFPKSITRLALAASLSLLTLPCHGQNVRLQFMTFPMTVVPLEVELLVSADQIVKLEVPSNELSEPIIIPRLPSLVFGKTVLDQDNKPTFDVYGKGKLTNEPKQLILLLRKGKDMADGFVVRSISSDIDSFGGGKLLFVNATTVDIGGRAGHVPFALKPASQTVVKPKLEANGRLAYVEFFYSEKGKPVPFFNSMWPVGKNNRGLIFFYQDPNNQNKLKLHTFRDFLGDDD